MIKTTVVGVVQTKGGTGKTTTAYGLAGYLADQSKKILLVDCDPQSSLTNAFKLKLRAEDGLSRALMKGASTGCISQTLHNNIHLIYNDDPQGDAGGVIPSFLRQSATNMTALSEALRKIDGQYDYVIIDSVGAKSVLQETVVYASDLILTPMTSTYLDLTSALNDNLNRLNSLLPLATVGVMPSGKPFPPIKVLVTRMDAGRSESQNILQHIHESSLSADLGELYPRLDTTFLRATIRNRTSFVRTIASGKFPHDEDKYDRDGQPSAATMLKELADELFATTTVIDTIEEQRD